MNDKPFFQLITKFNNKNKIKINTSLTNIDEIFYTLSHMESKNDDIFISRYYKKADISAFFMGTFVSSSHGLLTQKDLDILVKKGNVYDLIDDFCNGSYLVIIFKKEKKIEMYNDFWASLPVYFSEVNGNFIISNRYNLILNDTKKDHWDSTGVKEYLDFGRVLSGKTVIENIKMLLPAQKIEVTEKGSKATFYRTFPDEIDAKEYSFKEVVDLVSEEFNKSISRIYRDDKKYCLSFTGGSDSRMIFHAWPSKENLMTETSGDESNSDFIKARALTKKYGNSKLHKLEEKSPGKYQEGLFKYLSNIDDILLGGGNNSYHLDWKINRKADIRLSGIGGELLGGENLYLSRKPGYVLREGLLKYKYHKLNTIEEKERLLMSLFMVNKENELNSLFEKMEIESSVNSKKIVEQWDDYLGKTLTKEVYIERFRTWFLAFIGLYEKSNYALGKYSAISPYNDYNLVQLLSSLPPEYRELRRLQIAVMKKSFSFDNLPLDTTHLKISAPYRFHKFTRMLRFVFNIGFAKPVPFLQKGTALTTRKPLIFKPENNVLRGEITNIITSSNLFNKYKINDYLKPLIQSSDYSHFEATHSLWPQILKLLKLSILNENIIKEYK